MAVDSGISKKSRDRLQALAPGWGERLRRAVDELGGVARAASAIGLGQSQLSNLLSEGSVPSWPAMAMLARKSGYRQEWLAFNEEPERTTAPGSPSLPPPLMQEQFVWVPELDVQAAAGHGRLNEEHVEVKSAYPLPLNLVQAMGLPPDKLRIIEVKGDSNTPELNDGDRAVVYIGEEAIRDGKMYAINVGDDLLVKQLQIEPDGGVTLVSKNPSFMPRKISRAERSRLSIAGRVVFSIKRFL